MTRKKLFAELNLTKIQDRSKMDIKEFDDWMTQARLYAGYVEPTDKPSASLYLRIIEGRYS
ncbi:MAG: hypothetical protein OIN90_08015 [Candidatus Methanoperedens sp.]|nr:hypothetical protein [Candidatus Methanoperedens sp.]CAG0966939.1 hypothetical protein METP3_01205 [Methanosarcinales archaeon]